MRKNALYLKRILKLCLEFQTMIPLFFINRDELESLLFFTVSIFSFSPITKLGASSFTFTIDTISSLTFFPVLWEEYVFYSGSGWTDRWGCPQTIPAPLTSHSLTSLRSPRDQNSLSPIQTEFARAISNVNSQTLQCWLKIVKGVLWSPGLMLVHTWRAINLIAVFWNKSNDQRDKICWKNYRSNTNQIPSGARAHDDYALHILFRMQFLSSFSVFTEIKIKLD